MELGDAFDCLSVDVEGFNFAFDAIREDSSQHSLNVGDLAQRFGQQLMECFLLNEVAYCFLPLLDLRDVIERADRPAF